MGRISKHISYNEGVRSQTATRKDIDNTPGDSELASMRLLAEKVFEPLREEFDTPIYISSFFRSKKLNKKIGGSTTSQHCKGQAMDLDADVYEGVTNTEIFDYIKNNLDFDQLIWEFGTAFKPDWVHVSYVSPEQNRNRILRAVKEKGKSVYRLY